MACYLEQILYTKLWEHPQITIIITLCGWVHLNWEENCSSGLYWKSTLNDYGNYVTYQNNFWSPSELLPADGYWCTQNGALEQSVEWNQLLWRPEKNRNQETESHAQLISQLVQSECINGFSVAGVLVCKWQLQCTIKCLVVTRILRYSRSQDCCTIYREWHRIRAML